MQAATIRVRPVTRQTLAQLAARTHSSVQNVLDAAVEAYRRQMFLEQTNQALAGLRHDDQAWKEYRQEIEQWETTGKISLRFLTADYADKHG